jgi:hypothetical protein
METAKEATRKATCASTIESHEAEGLIWEIALIIFPFESLQIAASVENQSLEIEAKLIL